MAKVRRKAARAAMLVSAEARPTLGFLLNIRQVKVGNLPQERGFLYNSQRSILKVSPPGLNLIFSVAERLNLDGLAKDAFCEVALSLYLFHEAHHIMQGLSEFENVQAVKRIAGENRLGELDLIADTVAAQIFAAVETANGNDRKEYYCAAFVSALHFMIKFCFPAFGFPIARRHKVQRALGVVIMALLAEGELRRGEFSGDFDLPMYPYFSENFDAMMLMRIGGTQAMSLIRVFAKLNPDSTKAILEALDSGDLEPILSAARVFA
jgi:hypothetical protein